MKFHTKYLTFHNKNHREYINITSDVEDALRESGIREGMILVSAMHITAAVYVNDAESGLIQDIDDWLEEIAIEPDFDGTGSPVTILTGLFDQAALIGLLRRLYSLGLPLICVEYLEDE